MKRELSSQAQVAKRIRVYLKGLGIKCKVTSEGYSMGDNVNVKVYDQSPATIEKIKLETSCYKQGHFDGMTDSYEYSNHRNDIPQTKFLFIDNEISHEIRQKAWLYVKAHFGGCENLPDDVNKVAWTTLAGHRPVGRIIDFILDGKHYQEDSKSFWDSLAA